MPSPALSANGLLASLSAEDFEAIRPHLKTVELAQDRSLIELGEAVKHVHRARFICTVMNITFKLGHRLPVRPQPRFSHGLEGSTAKSWSKPLWLTGIRAALGRSGKQETENEQRPLYSRRRRTRQR